MQHRQIDCRSVTIGAAVRSKHPGCPVEQLPLPLGDLVGMNVELLSQLGQRLVASDGRQSHLRFEGGVWFRRGRLVIVSPGLQPFWLLSGRNSTYPDVQIS